MVIQLDFNECIKDSPTFRRNLCKIEEDLESFEVVFRKIYETSHNFYHDGNKYLESYRRMIDSFQLLGNVISDDEYTRKRINKFCHILSDSRRSEELTLFDIYKSIGEKVNKIIETKFKQLKETKKQFEKITHDLDSAYQKNADSSKSKPIICDENEKNLCGIKKSYGHCGIEYISQINKIYLIRGHSILDLIQAYTQSLKTFYQYGFGIIKDYDSEFADISSKIVDMCMNEKKLNDEMELKYDFMRENDFNSSDQQTQMNISNYSTNSYSNCSAFIINSNNNNNIITSGYLFKRSHNTFKKWNRRWFILTGSKLLYQKKTDSELSEMESDLRLCKVKEVNDVDRRSTFEIFSPKCRHILQADSQRECTFWMESIEKAINNALNNDCHSLDNDQFNNNYDSSNSSNDAIQIENELNNLSMLSSATTSVINTNSMTITNATTAASTATNSFTYINNNGSVSNRLTDMSVDNQNSDLMVGLGNSNESSSFNNAINNLSVSNVRSKQNRSSSQKLSIKRNLLNELYKINGNDRCADCSSTSNVTWASINLGILLCIECSGKHRGLGVHISKVRSIKLDDLDNETESLLLSLGNNVVNSIYEETYVVSNDTNHVSSVELLRATSTSDNIMRENWIRMKYLDKTFVKPILKPFVFKCTKLNNNFIYLNNNNENNNNNVFNGINYCLNIDDEVNIEDENILLHYASLYADLKLIMYSIALNADRNYIDVYNNNQTPLIKAVLSDSIEAVELLILNGAKVNMSDALGRTPLHYATLTKNLRIVCLLLKRGADPEAQDVEQVDPIRIAIESCQPNIVTILRVAKMNNDLKQQDCTYSGDPMFDDVLKDLLTLTSSNDTNNNNGASNDQSTNESTKNKQVDNRSLSSPPLGALNEQKIPPLPPPRLSTPSNRIINN